MNFNTRKINSSANQNHLKNHRLNDLLFEISCHRDSIAVDELRKKRIIAQVLHQRDISKELFPVGEPAKENARSVFRFVKMGVAAVVMLALLAAVYIWIAQNESRVFQPHPSSPAHSVQPEIAESNPGMVSQEDTSSLVLSSLVLNNVAIVHPGSGVEMAIGSDAQYQLAPKQSDGVNLQLSHGIVLISKDPHYKKLPLAIETPHLTIKVTGTSLSVKVTASATVVKVFDGEVQVTDTGKISHMLKAGNMLTTKSLSTTRTEPIPESSLERKQFVKLGLKVTHPQRNTLDSKLRGDHTEGGKEGDSTVHPSDNKDAAAVENNSFDALYAEIQRSRKEKHWQAAADGYEQLIRQFSGANSAQAAKVAIANLYLEKLHQPDIALDWYENYLQGNSTSLVPEALLGKAHALRELNQTDAEQRVLEQILQTYPETIYGLQAQQRLVQLQKR